MNVFPETRVHPRAQDLLSTGASDGDFLRLASSHSNEPGSVVLLSGGAPPVDGESRYSIAAWDPWMTFTGKGDRCRCVRGERSTDLEGDPLEILDTLLQSVQPDFPLSVPPFSGGAVGYCAYDLKNRIERLPQTARDDLDLPDIVLFWPRNIMIHDRLTGWLSVLGLEIEGEAADRPHPVCRESMVDSGKDFKVGELTSNFTHEAYLEAVRRVRRYIVEGDAYQVNLSQRYRFSFEGDQFKLWTELFRVNPAPFYAFVNAGGHQLLSTSMERFLRREGSAIETRPIKGTRKRGVSPEEDDRLRNDLLSHPKDDAELSMIVDLLRNDLGRICEPRTVRVTHHKRLESYRNVHHLVSIVTGELPPARTFGEIMRATFPGGSITGCPKIRAMEIIDELEPNVRHVYTGSIGYVGFHGNMDLNIAIRTALVHDGTCYFSVGGGIVYDSDEEEEYLETLHKGRTLFQMLEKLGGSVPNEE